MDLEIRKQEILRFIIDDYIRTAIPVGSKAIADRALQWSSATIRSEMCRLEEMGYLEQPHTSAGRIPSQKAYRFYVDRMMGLQKLTELELQQLHGLVKKKMTETHEVLGATAAALSQVTQYCTLVAGPNSQHHCVKQMHLVPIGDARVLLVLVTDAGILRDTILRVPEGMTGEELSHLSQNMAARLCGLSFDAATKEILTWMKSLHFQQQTFLEQISQTLQTAKQQGKEIHVDGAANLLQLPEYQDIHRAQRFYSALEARSQIEGLMRRNCNLQVSITIGRESGVEGMEDTSLVTAVYAAGGRELGTVGVLGPTRMQYGRVVSLLGAIGDGLAIWMEGER